MRGLVLRVHAIKTAASNLIVAFRRSLRRHCEELLRRSNPDCRCGGSLDCFAALAMTSPKLSSW
ncbi:hypothetical protein EAS56_35765 [Bradyrhizobium guangzhouense]|uniref:Transposase DDE domain-containing protein n=1 Tax=Bradyrhizobium guangzhouense TaxID=1325095 RepID=A0ABY0DXV3_9BRAD|nr:hypothetical protein EAS56_35765 [Bradyrhizobium guangzhouense]